MISDLKTELMKQDDEIHDTSAAGAYDPEESHNATKIKTAETLPISVTSQVKQFYESKLKQLQQDPSSISETHLTRLTNLLSKICPSTPACV